MTLESEENVQSFSVTQGDPFLAFIEESQTAFHFHSTAVIKTLWPKAVCEGKEYFSLYIQVTSHYWWRSGYRPSNENHGEMLFIGSISDLFTDSHWASFLKQLTAICLGMVLPTISRALLPQLIMKTDLPQTTPQANLILTVFQWKFSSSVTLGCAKLTTKAT